MDKLQSLQNAIAEITEIATKFGLDFFPMRYEVCPADIIYTFGAYGMPTRFTHWSFGKQFHKMKMHYDHGLSQIYELVINSDPCYAFLLDTNSLIQNKLIIAHVLAHSDFFKNNIRFANTRRDMVESMARTAERFTYYEEKYGKEKVERLIDAILSIQEHIDPSLFARNESEKKKETIPKIHSPYADLWDLDRTESMLPVKKVIETKKIPMNREKDILNFIKDYSHVLEPWEKDVLSALREEMIYFWPQLETKIMNEGWATYWHVRILREMDLMEKETIEFAKLHANVTMPTKTTINPYHLGLKIFEGIEKRYDHPTEEMKKRGIKENSGREKIFEVREIDSDLSFLRNYLTKEIVEEEDLYVFDQQGRDYRVTSKDYEVIRDRLLSMRSNGGFPYIYVENGNYLLNGELYLVHGYEGTELDLPYLENVLPYIYQLWGRTVHLETVVENKPVLFSSDGKKVTRKIL